MAEHIRRILAPFLFEEEGFPWVISYNGNRLTIHITDLRNRTHLDMTYDAHDIDLFYQNVGSRTGLRFKSAVCPGTTYELRFENEEPDITAFFETRSDENYQIIRFEVLDDRWLSFHDFVEARIFAPGAQQQEVVNEDPVAGGRRTRSRRRSSRLNKRTRRNKH